MLRAAAFIVFSTVLALAPARLTADEAPIAGAVKSVDPAAGTFVVHSPKRRGGAGDVTIHMRAGSRIIRFVRSTDAAKPGFREEPVTLADLRPGWTVSVKTRHEGDDEVAEVVRIVHER